ncbi:MAG TPA: HAMP domain-containing sensor histidine kinase [Kofleriaceae bacterium]|jgi:signal transduction histidine kinase
MADQRVTESTSEQAGSGHAADRDAAARSAVATEQTATEQLAALRHEIELRDDFISAVAHELRNPISPVYMQIEHLKDIVRESPGPIAQSWLLSQLESFTARFDRFLESLNRLLDASRLGAGHLVLVPERCDLVEVTRSVLASAQREIGASGCALALDAPATVTGWWDRLRLEQIVGNLVSNAIRYGAGAPIEIEIGEQAEVARLSVRDHGIGILAEDLPRIFQRFARARNVGRSAGFGIGLWVVAELCRAMAGRIDVESEPGRGSTFTVTLPRKR